MAHANRARGTGLLILASLLGLAVSLYDYYTPATNIDGTGGVMLVIGSTALMLGASLIVAARGTGSILLTLILLDILGTGTAAWFLESRLLLVAMLIGLIGWGLRLTGTNVTQGAAS